MPSDMLYQYDRQKDRQEKIDKIMCKTGYTWNETVKRCIPAMVGGGSGEITPNLEQIAGEAIVKEAAARQSGQ